MKKVIPIVALMIATLIPPFVDTANALPKICLLSVNDRPLFLYCFI